MDYLPQGAYYAFDILALYTFWRCSAFLIKQYLTRTQTVLYDIPNLGRPRPDEKRIKGTAVVCGGSYSGLWSARLLADHFEDVLIVEPEEWLATPEGSSPVYSPEGEPIEGRGIYNRARVFQYKTTHAFQPLSYAALKALYPSIDDEIRKADGRVGKSEFNSFFFNKYLLRTVKNCDGQYVQNFFMSREGCERMLRRLFLRDCPRIRWMTGTVKGVETVMGDERTLSSVVVRLPDNSEKTIPATLVVDCTGSAQAGLKWLKRISAASDKTAGGRLALSDPKMRITYYTDQQTRTFYFHVPPEIRDKLPIPGGYDRAMWMYSYTPVLAKCTKSLFLDRLEGHRIRFMVGAWGQQPLPEVEELRDYLSYLTPQDQIPKWILDLVDILVEANKGQVEYLTTKYPTLSWIKYEKAAYLPKNFVAVGDSVMQVNPTFGQGFSKAVASVVTLDSTLRSRSVINSTVIPDGFSARYFKSQAQRTAMAWEGTKPIDYLFPTTKPVEGEKPSDEYMNFKVTASMMWLSLKDEKLNSALYRAFNFLGPPGELMNPVSLAKVFLLWGKQKVGLAKDFLQD
ncbi:hypothetical protein ACEPAI_7881 [Sanghuangporus weigelae]